MTLTKRFEENKLTIIGTATLLLLLGAGFQSGIFSSRESMEQFLRQTGVLAPLCFLLLQTIQVVIPVVSRGCQLYHRCGDFRPTVRLLSELCRNGHRFCVQFSPGKALWAGLSFKVCTRKNLSEIHFPGRKRKEIRCIFPSGFDPSRYA